MIVAIDVGYNENNIAKAVCVGFHDWADEKAITIVEEFVIGLEPYQPGEFYKRELPCILKVLQKVEMRFVNAVIVDGYVYLDDTGKPGLGYYLYEALGRKIPVIGVAKTNFHDNTKNVIEVVRRDSNKPLFVTSIGIEVEVAAENIKKMHGAFRLPTLLKKADTISRR